MIDENLKERLVGAAVLVFLAVIFIPMFLTDEPPSEEFVITETNIPEKPQSTFSSRIVPLEISKEDKPEPQPEEELIEEVEQSDKGKQAEKEESAVKAEVTVEGNAQPKQSSETTEVGVKAWIVQLGSFSSEENAQSLNQKLREKNYPAFVEPLVKGDTVVYRVRVGPELRREDAEKTRSVLKKTMKLDGILVKYP